MKILTLQPPSPPYLNVKRDYAGGMGVADPSVRPAFGHDRGYITLPYMSLLYAAAVLEREGHTVVFVDAQADGLGMEELVSRVRDERPTLVVSVVNLPSIFGDLQVLRELKERVPGLRIVAVGTICSPLFAQVAAAGAADVVIRGDPEAVIAEVASALGRDRVPDGFGERDGVLTNREPARVTDLDALPALPYHLVPLDKYWYHGFGQEARFAAVFASRGCSFKCYYCPYPAGFGGCIVHRDPIKVVDEIETLQKQYGVEGILFRDQVFTMDWEKTHRLCDDIIRRKLKLKWVVETRLDRVNEELLGKMKAAGCVRIHYGLESGDPALFSRVGKDGAEGRMERLLENFTLTERIGIHPHMFMLVGLLGETWKTIAGTIDVIRRIKPVTLQVAIVTPYPGTGLYDEVKTKGLLLTEDWSQFTGFKAVARTEELTSIDLLKARTMIIREHRKAVFWKKIRQKARLFASYLLDGSLWRRAGRHFRQAAVSAWSGLRRMAKQLVCRAMCATGLVWVYGRRYNRRRPGAVRILSAHRVIDPNGPLDERDRADLQRGCLSLGDFETRIRYLKKHYNVLRLEEYARRLSEGVTPPPNAVILTFDDAYKDVIKSAHPILRAQGIPFTVFLTGNYVGPDSDRDRMLSEADVAALAADPLVTWGAHGMTHRWLTNMPAEQADAEIRDSKTAVERLTGKTTSLFCYPDGKFDEETVRLLKTHGFAAACSTRRGVNGAGIDPYALKRIPFEAEPFARFALRMAGLV